MKIQSPKYPEQIKKLGDHIRAKRLDNKQFQKDVAKIIGVSEESINHWETKQLSQKYNIIQRLWNFLATVRCIIANHLVNFYFFIEPIEGFHIENWEEYCK